MSKIMVNHQVVLRCNAPSCLNVLLVVIDTDYYEQYYEGTDSSFYELAVHHPEFYKAKWIHRADLELDFCEADWFYGAEHGAGEPEVWT